MSNLRRDFQTGENLGHILNHYFRGHTGAIPLEQFNRGTSFRSRDSNWALIRKFLARAENNNLIIPAEELNGTLHGKPGAAEVIIMRFYQYFTGSRIKTLVGEYNFDFT